MMNTEQHNLTANQCRELAEALLEEAAALPEASKKPKLLQLAQSYHDLAELKSLVARKTINRAVRTMSSRIRPSYLESHPLQTG